jgi:LacI family transcriptional regulator
MESPRDSTDGRRVPPSARRPTMREVAALAEVSLSTVSRVVNGSPPVAAELARRVEQAVEILGYRHDQIAGSLRRANRASATIGLVFEDVANPFFAALYRGVEEVATARGVLAIAGSTEEDPVRERELAHAFCARRVDGLVIAPVERDHSYLLREREAGRALVYVDRSPELFDADVVLIDNAGAARVAVEHLVAAGHRRIGFLGERQRIWTARERLAGYRDGLARHGIPYDPELVRVELGDSDVSAAATRELVGAPDSPTALLAAQNLITIGAVRALQQLGRQHDVALVGIDDLVLADAVEPGITVVAQDAPAIGRAAAELLFSRLDGERSAAQMIVIPTRLIERGSGELHPHAT